MNDENEAVAFAERWGAIQAKLTHKEQDLVATVVSGSEVNHSLLYIVISTVVGILIGGLAVHLLS